MTHRRLKQLILAAAAFAAIAGVSTNIALVAAAPPAQPTSDKAPRVSAVSSIGITVSDLDRSVDFYTQVLGFDKQSEIERSGDALERQSGVFGARCRVARLKLGDELVELTEFLAPQGRPIPVDSQSNDLWFQHIAIVVSDMDKAYAHLRMHKVRHASSGPQTLPPSNPNAGGISAFYFKDPDGHNLEVIHFPNGKGDPRWQNPTSRLFLGIDHTAIVVSDTDRSLAFYRDCLGMKVVGASENFGTEQEHLNNVFGARLRITALRAPSGPGVEFLEYLAPSDGRPAPVDTRACDLSHWHTTIVTTTPESLSDRLRSFHVSWVSAGFVPASEGSAAHIKDPDGHAVMLITEGLSHASHP